MGLFNKHKEKDKTDKNRPHLLNPVPTAPPPTSSNTNPAQQNSQNSYHDSAFYSTTGSSMSGENDIQRQQQQQLRNQPPGTTITTTTTTTTTVTTVTSDGRTFTQVHPYDASTDPPVRTQETTISNDTSRTSTLGGTSNTNSISNPNSANNVPQSQTYTQSTTNQLQPNPQQPEVQRTKSPGRKPTPQGLQSDSKFNIIPPTPQGSQSSKDTPQSPTTTGGRIIPPRSEKRSSPRNSFGNSNYIAPEPEFMNDGPVSPGPPMRSEKRNSMDRGLSVAPLKTSHSPSNSGSQPVSAGGYGNEQPRSSYEAPPVVPPKDDNDAYFNDQRYRDSGYEQNQGYSGHDQYPQQNTYTPVGGNNSPLASGGLGPEDRSHTPNYSRPGPTVTSPSHFDPPPTSAQAQSDPAQPSSHQPHEKGHHRQSLANMYKGFQGASEALRGTINSGIAKGTRDKAEQERMRAIRDQGWQDYKSSGLGDRMFGGRVGERNDGSRRLRKRSLSRNGVHGTEGPGGLESVEERSIGDGR